MMYAGVFDVYDAAIENIKMQIVEFVGESNAVDVR
jgi:hypothetical protein